MIDATAEELITLAEACNTLPRRRRGKRPAVSTLYRWASQGVNGVRLETLQCAGTKVTSREALARFLVRLTSQAEESTKAKRHDSAERELARDGWGTSERCRSPPRANES